MKIKELYKHRTDFTIIGLTGRNGSGCSQLSKLLNGDFNNLKKGLRNKDIFSDIIFKRKFEICSNYISHNDNWQKFEVIEYKKVLLIYIFKEIGNKYFGLRTLLYNYYKESKIEDNKLIVDTVFNELISVLKESSALIKKINDLPDFKEIRNEKKLLELNEIFFGNEFKKFTFKVFNILEKNNNYFRRTYLLHHISCNIRSSKKSSEEIKTNPDNVYTIAELINTIIKAKKKANDSNGIKTKIVIDSLRNSLEIMFFKERYSAFYMIATKDILNNSQKRLDYRLKKKIIDDKKRNHIVKKIIDLDATEFKTKDFSSGIFTSPDVENCIQKSDFHIFNLKKNQINRFFKQFINNNSINEIEKGKIINTFLTREEQLLKLISLINQPGLITPSASERNMQIAYTAKLNSGCISRQVGAVITDKNFIAKSIGWNDVSKGHTPCNLRNVGDFFSDDLDTNPHYSDFEKGKVSNVSDFKYKSNSPKNFKNAIIDFYGEKYEANKNELNGKNCSFCFKTIHNYYEGESNQVHTRSLHAEENAMLQLTKFGGLGVEGGFLFTTASPCELCSKKAYQLGIRIIYYIDPYPGIAVDQILNGGKIKPMLIPFSGAIGNSYHKLYEQYLSTKDEITMSLELNDKNIHLNQFKNILKKIYPNYEELDKIKSISDVRSIIDGGLSSFEVKDLEF